MNIRKKEMKRMTALFYIILVSTTAIVGTRIMAELRPRDKWIYPLYVILVNAAATIIIFQQAL